MMEFNSLSQKSNITLAGQGEPTLVLAHGFGSDQTAWRYQVSELAAQHRTVLFDHLGCGKADVSDYSPRSYNTLSRYAEDVLSIYRALGLSNTIFIGHSVSAMIGVLASLQEPAYFSKLVFVGASPRYLNDDGYIGGFEQADLNGLYEAMNQNYLGWANGFAPFAMGNADRPELGQEFAHSLSAMRPDIAQSTARMIFESDLRNQLALIQHPVLILQSQHDPVVPPQVGEYLAAHIKYGSLKVLNSYGHLPHLSAPAEVTSAIREFIES
jgi:sigma-B regulation protein RsbQ